MVVEEESGGEGEESEMGKGDVEQLFDPCLVLNVDIYPSTPFATFYCIRRSLNHWESKTQSFAAERS